MAYTSTGNPKKVRFETVTGPPLAGATVRDTPN
jgi:hypothetical protein